MKKIFLFLFIISYSVSFGQNVHLRGGQTSQTVYDPIYYLGFAQGDTVSAINKAIAVASANGGGIVLLKSGNWGIRTSYLSSNSYKPVGIIGASNVTLQGEGVGKTVIIQDAPPVGSTFDTTSFATNTHFANIITCTNCNNFNITDLSINGTLSRQINHTTNPYSNPQYGLGSDTVQTNAIGIIGGNGNYIYGVRIDSVQGYGVSINKSYQAYISRIYAATSINGGVFFVNVCNGSVLTNSIITNNYADNVRLLSGNITIDNCEVSWSKFNNRGGTNANFAGIYVQNNSKSLTRSITVSNCSLHDNSSYGVDCFNVDTTNYTWQGTTVSVIGNQIYHNAGGGIQVQMQWMSIEGNQIFNNGQDSNGVIDPEGAPGWGIIGHGSNSNGLFINGNVFRNNADSGQQLYAFGIGSVGTIPVLTFTNNIQSGGLALMNTASFGLKSSAPYNTIFGNTLIDSARTLSSDITLDNIGNLHFSPKVPTLGGTSTGTIYVEGLNDAFILGSHAATSNRAFNIVDQYGIGGQSELGLRFSESGAYISSGSGDTARSGAFYDFKNSLNRGGWNSLGEFIWGPSTASRSILIHQPSYVIPSGGNMVEITGAASGSSGGAYNLISAVMSAGYTGSGITRGQFLQNLSVGTGSNIGPTGVAVGNYGLVSRADGASATGANIGNLSFGTSALKNIGLVGDATTGQFNSASAISGGVIGYALRSNASAIEFGGYFGLQSSLPTFQSAALIADNGGESVPVFLARVNGTTKVQVTTTGDLSVATGNALLMPEGTNGRVGQTVLVAGTKAITISGLTTSSRAFIALVSPSGASSTIQYQAVCTANTLTIQANVAAGTINTADGSTLNYFVIN